MNNSFQTQLQTDSPARQQRVLLQFEDGNACLSNSQIDILKGWLKRCSSIRKTTTISISGAYKASRAGMLRRIHHLLQILLHLGIFAPHIQQDARWLNPEKMGAMDDLPSDTVWLELKPA